jgi:uncharacterized membrane protein YcaP (DUF421 family)
VLAGETPLSEIVVRVVVIYVALLTMMRIAGKREIGSLGPIDLMAMLLLSETVSPALTNQDSSLAASLTAAATLIALTTLVSYVSYRYRPIERLVDGEPRVLIEHGKIIQRVMDSERISQQDLEAALREHGLESPGQVTRAVVETTGRISVISKEGG